MAHEIKEENKTHAAVPQLSITPSIHGGTILRCCWLEQIQHFPKTWGSQEASMTWLMAEVHAPMTWHNRQACAPGESRVLRTAWAKGTLPIREQNLSCFTRLEYRTNSALGAQEEKGEAVSGYSLRVWMSDYLTHGTFSPCLWRE